MKNKCGFIVIVILLLFLLTFCELPTPEVEIIIVNNTNDDLSVVIEVDGDNPVEYSQGYITNTTSYYIPYNSDEGALDVLITISNVFRSKLEFPLTITSSKTQTLEIYPDQGAITFVNHHEDHILNIWAVRENPADFTDVDQISQYAGCQMDNVTLEEAPRISCSAGTYYCIYQTADGYWYSDTAVNVYVGQDAGFMLELYTLHPLL